VINLRLTDPDEWGDSKTMIGAWHVLIRSALTCTQRF